MTDPLGFLVDLLNLRALDDGLFEGPHPEGERQRTFGGQIAALAQVAAGRTVDQGHVHSLHSYFLRPGDSSAPTTFEVDRIRDGRSFTTRRVVAYQHGKAIYNQQTSFHVDEVGPEHQFTMPEAPDPDTLAPLEERVMAEFGYVESFAALPQPIDQRYVGALPWSAERPPVPTQRLWIRAKGTLADDPLLHAAVITYASDMNLFDTILGPTDLRWGDNRFMGASLDHCMWFHRPVRADDWLLYDMDSPTAHGGRGLARGFLYARDGSLAVSMVQEGLIRPVEEPR